MSFPETVDEILDVSEDEGKVWEWTEVRVKSGDRMVLWVLRECSLSAVMLYSRLLTAQPSLRSEWKPERIVFFKDVVCYQNYSFNVILGEGKSVSRRLKYKNLMMFHKYICVCIYYALNMILLRSTLSAMKNCHKILRDAFLLLWMNNRLFA